jgi:hypothetical protein
MVKRKLINVFLQVSQRKKNAIFSYEKLLIVYFCLTNPAGANRAGKAIVQIILTNIQKNLPKNFSSQL